jgi:alginate O-acetyltransferase complex protein AlgI
MPEISLLWILWFLPTLLVSRLVPLQSRMDWMAASGFLFLAFHAPWSCLLLSVGALLTAWAVHRSSRGRSQLPLLLVVAYSGATLLLHGLRVRQAGAEAEQVVALVGTAYFACRQMHVAFEAYAGRLPGLTFADQMRYQFFLPTILLGPIHRIKGFTRSCLRRREQPGDFYTGLERALFGSAKVAIIANLVVQGVVQPWLETHGPAGFAGAYLSGCVGWIWLYFTFAGYSDIAIGFARSYGIPVEENFNRPWQAKNLIDFWQRWHMTLSNWCRDYVYAPLAAATRRHGLALLAAMLVMGVWHEVSVYYVVWGVYHASGIVLCRKLQGLRLVHRLSDRHPGVMMAAARCATFAWLAGSAPVVSRILELAKGAPA